MNIGAIWTPNDQFSAKFDYWSIDYTDVITIESAQGKVIADPNGPDVQRLVDGTLIGVTTRYKNAFLYLVVTPIRVPSTSLCTSGPLGSAITLPWALSIVITSV